MQNQPTNQQKENQSQPLKEPQKKRSPKRKSKTTAKQRKAVKLTLENLGAEKPKSQGEILKEAGYGPGIVKNPQIITESKGWNELMKKYLDDDTLLKNHEELFKQKQVEYFVFSKQMKDEEIIGHVEAAGFKVITVRESDKGKLAFYSIPNVTAIINGLDKAYKLKGKYVPEQAPPAVNNFNLFFDQRVQLQVKQFEQNIKSLIDKDDPKVQEALEAKPAK